MVQPTTDVSTLSFEEIELLVAERRQQLEEEEGAQGLCMETPESSPEAQFPHRTLLWMALLPHWTLSLALNCDFPAVPDQTVEQTLEKLCEEGLAIKNPLVAHRYEIESCFRTKVLGNYLNDPAGFEGLRNTLIEIGTRINKVGADVPDLQPPVRRWALLAAEAGDVNTMANVFDEMTWNAFRREQSAELLNWIDTGRPLSALFKSDVETPMKLALQKAGRRLELIFRREVDDQHLNSARFFEREDQINAFKEFLAGPPEKWALHFVGAGGVGKTMLMRRITTGLAEELGAVTARIDFDYFNADYPRLAPGVLLWSFGQELRLYDQDNKVSGSFEDADRLLRELHGRLRSDHLLSEQRATRDPLFRDALIGYISAFRALSRQLNRKILLVVDTCEELARSRPDGGVPENVEETFRILRALHDGPDALLDDNSPPDASQGLIDELRVIFSGRRLLAEAGDGWHLKYTEEPAENRVFVNRPYLKLFEIRGFTHDEARSYLDRHPDVPQELVEPIIYRSTPEAGGIKGLVRDNLTPHTPEVPRCNPYEFIFYRDWAMEKPPPKPETIRTATSAQYVELRILRRLKYKPLESLMPAVALLGRFSSETLEAASTLEHREFKLAFEELQRQEWIDNRTEPTSDGKEVRLVLNVEHGVRTRLLAYYTQQGDLNILQARAADYLEELTLKEDLGQLDWSSFDAAMRVLEPDPRPERAFEWWQKVVERILQERDWHWMLVLLSYLKGEDGAGGTRPAHGHTTASVPTEAGGRMTREDAAVAHQSGPFDPVESSLRPAVLATYAAALMNTAPASLSEVNEVWRQVWEKFEVEPAANLFSRRLELRALAGVVSSTRYIGKRPEREQVEALWRVLERIAAAKGDAAWVDEQVLAALVAAAETIVEQAEVETEANNRNVLAVFQYASPDAHERPEIGPVKLARFIDTYRREAETERDAVSLSILFAFAATLAGRSLLLKQDVKAAQQWFELALAEIERSDEATRDKSVRFDWQPPIDLAARVRLEFVRAAYPRMMSPVELLKRAESWPTDIENIDAERLCASLIALRLAEGPVRPSDFGKTGSVHVAAGDINLIEKSFMFGPVSCKAHSDVPPLFLVLAEALAVNGRVGDVVKQLDNILARSTTYGHAVTRHAERAHARISRRMRLNDESTRDYETLVKTGHVSDLALVWAIDGLDGRKSQRSVFMPPKKFWDKDERPLLHAVWQTRYVLSKEKREQALAAALESITPDYAKASFDEQSDFYDLSLAFDAVEVWAVNRAPVSVKGDEPAHGQFKPFRWWSQHPTQPEEALILSLRSLALRAAEDYFVYRRGHSEELQLLGELAERVGKRRAAEIAHHEGELLALRLPRHLGVTFLLLQAGEWYLSCEDYAGAVASGLTYLMTQGRKAKSKPVSATRKTVSEAYEKLRQQNPAGASLPAWESSADARKIPLVSLHGWRPLLIRLVLIQANEQLNERPSETQENLSLYTTTLVKPYGVESPEGFLLPADLELWFGDTQNNKPPSTSRTPLIIGLTILFALLAGLIVGGYYLFLWVAGFFIGIRGMNPSRQFGIYVATWPLVIFICWRLVKEIRVTLAEADSKDALSIKLGHSWKSTLVYALLLAVAVSALQLKIGNSPLRAFVESSAYLKFAGHDRPLTFWQGIWMLLIAGGLLIPGLILLFRGLRTIARLSRRSVARVVSKFIATFTINMSIASGTKQSSPSTASRGDVPPVDIAYTLRPHSSVAPFVPERIKKKFDRSISGVVIPSLVAYSEIGEKLPPENLEDYASLRDTLKGDVLEVQMDIAEGLHGPCWEALIVFGLRKQERSPRDLPFRFRRTTPVKKSREPETDGPAVLVSWTDSHVGREVAKRGWEQLSGDVYFDVQLNTGDYDLLKRDVVKKVKGHYSMAGGDNLSVLHLIGTAEDGNTGVSFRLARNDLSMTSKSLETVEEAILLKAESLTDRFTNLSLCILQGDPDKWSGEQRLGDTRNKAMLARIFASRLFEQGVPAVLVIPPLKGHPATAALRIVAAALARRQRLGTKELLGAVAEIQELIVNSFDKPTPEAWEVALDATLYADKRWDGRLGELDERQIHTTTA